MRRFVSIIMVLLLSLSLITTSGCSSSNKGREENVAVFAYSVDPATFNVHKVRTPGYEALGLCSMLYFNYTRTDYVPYLAKSYEIITTDNGDCKIKLEISPDMKYSTGEALEKTDVLESYRYRWQNVQEAALEYVDFDASIKESAGNDNYVYLVLKGSSKDGASEIEKRPASYIQIVMNFLSSKASAVMDWSYYQSVGESEFDKKPCFYGLFSFESRDEGVSYTFARNEYYKDFLPNKKDDPENGLVLNNGVAPTKKIVIKIIPNLSTQGLMFIKGEIDLLPTIDATISDVLLKNQKTKGYSIITKKAGTASVIFNINDSILSNQNVRKAIVIAYNQQSVVDAFNVGISDPKMNVGEYSLNEKYPNFDETKLNERKSILEALRGSDGSVTAGIKTAKSILDQEGWELNSSDGIRYKDGKKMTIKVQIWAGLLRLFQRFANDMKNDLGIDMIVEEAQWPNIQTNLENGNWQIEVRGPLADNPCQCIMTGTYVNKNKSEYGIGYGGLAKDSKVVEKINYYALQKISPELYEDYYEFTNELYYEKYYGMPFVGEIAQICIQKGVEGLYEDSAGPNVDILNDTIFYTGK